jgi:hypothetical protein
MWKDATITSLHSPSKEFFPTSSFTWQHCLCSLQRKELVSVSFSICKRLYITPSSKGFFPFCFFQCELFQAICFSLFQKYTKTVFKNIYCSLHFWYESVSLKHGIQRSMCLPIKLGFWDCVQSGFPLAWGDCAQSEYWMLSTFWSNSIISVKRGYLAWPWG